MRVLLMINRLDKDGKKVLDFAYKVEELSREMLPDKGDNYDLHIGVPEYQPTVCKRIVHPHRGREPKGTTEGHWTIILKTDDARLIPKLVQLYEWRKE